jgi:hypothetical protein
MNVCKKGKDKSPLNPFRVQAPAPGQDPPERQTLILG